MNIPCEINGRPVNLQAEPHEMLTEVLHRRGYKSVKRGCDTGSCGVCVVLLDGKPVASCRVPAPRVEGHVITTVEGASEDARLLGERLVAEGADQCGFCSPGFVLTVLAMKLELDNPSDEDINHYLAGNLCRCTGYAAQLRGVHGFLEATR